MQNEGGGISESSSTISEESAGLRGAVVTPIYASRDVLHYAVTDHELKSVSYLNSQLTVFASIGSFLLAVSISIATSLVIEDEKPEITLSLGITAGVIAVVSLGSLWLAFLAWRSRNAEIDSIKGTN